MRELQSLTPAIANIGIREGGVIIPFPRPRPPVAHAERLRPASLQWRVEVAMPSIADVRHPRHDSTRSPAGP